MPQLPNHYVLHLHLHLHLDLHLHLHLHLPFACLETRVLKALKQRLSVLLWLCRRGQPGRAISGTFLVRDNAAGYLADITEVPKLR
jgi:hypothetical protein